MIITVWPKGYAHADGTKTLHVAEGADYAAESHKAYPYCSIVSIRKPATHRVETFSAEYIREMSKGG